MAFRRPRVVAWGDGGGTWPSIAGGANRASFHSVSMLTRAGRNLPAPRKRQPYATGHEE
jgi:hypothetical protein